MAYRVFIDGGEGTTGLELEGRLAARPELSLLKIDPARRKDPAAREALLNEADVSFLCLPDAAAREAVSLVHNPSARVIDASTAHRTAPGWEYGFPELSEARRAAIARSKRVAVPGCHATGFASLVYPLVAGGILPKDATVACRSLSGYSGGGKKMIAQYETGRAPGDALCSPRAYALTLRHKHLPEMQAVSGLSYPPLFEPAVCDFRRGMLVTLPLFRRTLAKPLGAAGLRAFYREYYANAAFVRVLPEGEGPENGFLAATRCNFTNRLDVMVFGDDERVLAAAVLDNLGKGASGAAVQCMNLMLGLPEKTGLAEKAE